MHALKLADTMLFLSTLSLRRATRNVRKSHDTEYYFYPRSPCGERLEQLRQKDIQIAISIHALLAESDRSEFLISAITSISIHALLAESDQSSASLSP